MDPGETEVEAKIRGMLEALTSRFEACSIREHREKERERAHAIIRNDREAAALTHHPFTLGPPAEAAAPAGSAGAGAGEGASAAGLGRNF